MVEMHGVFKVFPPGIVALSNIGLTIERGEFVFVVGPSGAGKSTLVRLIYREDVPTRGYVFIGGRNIARLRRQEVSHLRRNIGVVFQDFKLLGDRNVYDNVAFAMRVTEAAPREIRRRVPEVLDWVGLVDRMKAMPYELSGGEQQRVSLARAIVNNPAVLIADEPTGNLDADTAWGIIRLLEEANLRGSTVIVATHARYIVDALRRRVIALDKGRVVRDDAQGVYSA